MKDMALWFDSIGTKYQPRTLAINFGECYKGGSRPHFKEIGEFLRRKIKLDEDDVEALGEHDTKKYFSFI